MGKNKAGLVQKNQPSITSFFGNQKKSEEIGKKDSNDNDHEKILTNSESSNHKKGINEEEVTDEINQQKEQVQSEEDNGSEKTAIKQQTSKRAKLALNGKKIQKIQKKQKEKLENHEQDIQIQRKESEQFSMFDDDQNLLDSLLENSNQKTLSQQQQQQKQQQQKSKKNSEAIVMENENEEEGDLVFESDNNEGKKQNEDNNNSDDEEEKEEMQEEDYYQKVMQMTDDESEEESHKQDKKKKKKNKKKLDESFSLNEDGENEDSDSDSEEYDDGSDFSSEQITSRKRGNGKRRAVDLTGEPLQRKQRKVILSSKQIQKIKYPYEVASSIRLLAPGEICLKPGYHSKYNFFPIGYKCERLYASCIHKNEKTTYVSEILEGKKGKPLFKVTAADNLSNPVQAESSSQCWKKIAEAAKKLNTGSKKVSISGPEQYGLQNQMVQQILEKLPNADLCPNYYANCNNKNKQKQDDNSKEQSDDQDDDQDDQDQIQEQEESKQNINSRSRRNTNKINLKEASDDDEEIYDEKSESLID